MNAPLSTPKQTGLPRPQRVSPALPEEWHVAVGAAALLFLGFGIVYSMPSLHVAQHAVLGGSTADLGIVFSAAGALYYALGPISGRLADRHGATLIVICGMLTIALSLAASSLARSNLEFDLVYGLGVGFGIGLTFVPTLGAVQRFCGSWRASATGLASLGLGLGALIAPPAAAVLAERVGPAQALAALAVVAGLGSAFALLLRPVNHRNRLLDVRPRLLRGAFCHVRRAPVFARLYASSLCFALAAFVPFAHLPSIAEQMGWTPRAGALLVGAVGFGSAVARLGLGLAVSLFGARRTLAHAGIMLAIGLFAVALSGSFVALTASAIVIGLGYGGGTAALPPLVAETYGAERVSEIVGDVFTARSIGILIGPAAAGLAFERLSTFVVPFLLCSLLAFASTILLAPFPSISRAAAAPTAEVSFRDEPSH